VLRHRQRPAAATGQATMTAARLTTGAMLRVDPISCDGRRLCAEVLPELISLDDWGFPIMREGAVPNRLRAAASEAVRICPRLALMLEPAEKSST
jgi:ferredoxin